MGQIFYVIRGSFNCMFLIDCCCTDGGTDDSLSSSSVDRFNFIDFSLICAPEPDLYVYSQNALNYCTIKINHDINVYIVLS